MIRRPPRSTRTDTRFPYTTLFRSHAAVPAPVTEAHAEAAPPPPAPIPSLLRHPDFARRADQETDPLLGTTDNIVTVANDAAVRLLGRHIVGADIRTAIRHPAATERSEERRVGKECVRKCRTRGSPYH